MKRSLANRPPAAAASEADGEPGGVADPAVLGLSVVQGELLDPASDETDDEALDFESEEDEATDPTDVAQLESSGLVGSLVWSLRKGDIWVLAPESAFLFTDCWRKALLREAWMLERETPTRQTYVEGIATMARRWITGEPAILDLYVHPRALKRYHVRIVQSSGRSTPMDELYPPVESAAATPDRPGRVAQQ